MFQKKPFDIELERQIVEQKDSLALQFEINFKTQEETLQTIIKARQHADSNNFRSNTYLWNVAGYVNIISYDLKICGQELTFATREWTKKYFARQTCLLIYESLNDLQELLGKQFRIEIDKLSNKDRLIESLNDISKRLNDFKKENNDRLKNIRNVSIAHRDQDSFEQIKIIDSIKWNEVIGYMMAFDKIIIDLGHFLQIVLKKSSSELDR
jgi:hypothetical protein